MQRRPAGKHYGGYWEVPGGKVEPGELPGAALVRELREELGVDIAPGGPHPLTFAAGPRTDAPGVLVILLYTITAWRGEPRACEPGASIGWFTPEDMASLLRPPLDIAMCDALAATSW